MKDEHLAQFRDYVETIKRDPDECWPFDDEAVTRNLYGYFKGMHGHKVSYLAFHGPIESGMWVRHTCDHRWCVNPNHLVCGTPQQNGHDKSLRDPRLFKGEYHDPTRWSGQHSVLTDDDVREIRRIYVAGGVAQLELGERYGISQSAVSKIVRRRNWPHV